MKKKPKVKKAKKPSKKLKYFNVFYQPMPVEHELIIEAYDEKDALKKAVDAIGKYHGNLLESIRVGWEVKPDVETEIFTKNYNYKVAGIEE